MVKRIKLIDQEVKKEKQAEYSFLILYILYNNTRERKLFVTFVHVPS